MQIKYLTTDNGEVLARCGSGLTFTHLYLVTSNLLPNFLITVTHSFFNIMSSLIPLDKNGGSREKNAQVKILIRHLLMALRGVYKKTGIVDDPVIYNLENRGGGLRIQGLTA